VKFTENIIGVKRAMSFADVASSVHVSFMSINLLEKTIQFLLRFRSLILDLRKSSIIENSHTSVISIKIFQKSHETVHLLSGISKSHETVRLFVKCSLSIFFVVVVAGLR